MNPLEACSPPESAFDPIRERVPGHMILSEISWKHRFLWNIRITVKSIDSDPHWGVSYSTSYQIGVRRFTLEQTVRAVCRIMDRRAARLWSR